MSIISKGTIKSAIMESLSESNMVTVQPTAVKAQVVKQGDKTVGTTTNPAVANQLKQAIEKGELDLDDPDALKEADAAGDWVVEYYKKSKPNKVYKHSYPAQNERVARVYAKLKGREGYVTTVYQLDPTEESPVVDQNINESIDTVKAARLTGKAHALAGESYNCKYEGEAAREYLAGYKEGLDEAYGDCSPVDSFDAKVAIASPDDLEVTDTLELDDFTDSVAIDPVFEALQNRLNSLLEESKMKEVDIDMTDLSEAEFKRKYGKTKSEMNTELTGIAPAAKQPYFPKPDLAENTSVSVHASDDQPLSVSVSASGEEADALLDALKSLLGRTDVPAPVNVAPVGQAVVPSAGQDITALVQKDILGGCASHDHSEECEVCGNYPCTCEPAVIVAEEDDEEDEELTQDTEFMTKTISGGLNNIKRDQSTGNITKTISDELEMLRRLSGL